MFSLYSLVLLPLVMQSGIMQMLMDLMRRTSVSLLVLDVMCAVRGLLLSVPIGYPWEVMDPIWLRHQIMLRLDVLRKYAHLFYL